MTATAERTYSVPAIHCEGCAGTIEEALEPVEGVESGGPHFPTERLKDFV